MLPISSPSHASSATPPAAANYGSDAHGLVYGFHFQPDGTAQMIDSAQALQWLLAQNASEDGDTGHVPDRTDGFLWLHFNLVNAACRPWMEQHLDLSPVFFEALDDSAHSSRIEFADDCLIGVLNDVLFDFSFDASHISTLVLSVKPRLLVTARARSLRSIDRLRVAVQNQEPFATPVALLVHLLRDQADVLSAILRDSIAKVDIIEDRLLAGGSQLKRADLGQLRRVLVRLKRLLAPEPAALFRLLNRRPHWMISDDAAELRQSTEEFSLALNDIDTLQERIKLLQEELSAQVQEQNNRSLFMLTVFTVLALPVNMIAGLFGMNVGGIPFAQEGHGFWLVVTVVVSITVLVGWWIFRRHDL